MWSAVATVVLAAAAGTVLLMRQRGPAAKISSIAVLPFANANPDPNTDYLTDGITEELINTLSQLPDLRVVARTTAFHYKGSNDDPQKIGRDLNVSAVLTGTVTRQGEEVLVQADLIQVSDGSELWGRRYSRSLAELSAVQQGIARDISERLGLRLGREQQRFLSQGSTESQEAYQLYLKGRYFWNQRTRSPAALKQAVEYFQQAVEKDPGYARAYAGLADAYHLSSRYFLAPPQDVNPKAKAAAMKALELDDGLAEAHASLGILKGDVDRDWAGEEAEYKRALALNPNYATVHHWYSVFLCYQGRFAECTEEARRALELDPLSLPINQNLGDAYFYARQYDQAIEQYKKAVELEPGAGGLHNLLAFVYFQKGMYPQFIAEVERGDELNGDPDDAAESAELARVSPKTDYQQALRIMLRHSLERSKHTYVPPYFVAGPYALLGDKQHAFEYLEKAYRENDPYLASIKVEPVLDNLRSDPRYQDLVRRMGLAP